MSDKVIMCLVTEIHSKKLIHEIYSINKRRLEFDQSSFLKHSRLSLVQTGICAPLRLFIVL